MAFNLKSGNRPNFKKLGSNSYKPTGKSSSPKSSPIKSFSPLRQTENESNEGADWLQKDLESEGYKKRLANELEIEGGKTTLTTPEEGDKYYTTVEKPTAEQILDIRKSRLEHTTFHPRGEHGDVDVYGTQAVQSSTEKGKLKKGGDIYYNPAAEISERRKVYLDIHEGAHAVTASEHGMFPSTQKLLIDAKGGDASLGDINEPEEIYARYKVTQKWMQDNDIFDAFSGDEFTNEDYNEVMEMLDGVTRENFQEKGIPYEVITFFGDDKNWEGHGFNKKISKKDAKFIMNNVADSNRSNSFEISDDVGNISTIT